MQPGLSRAVPMAILGFMFGALIVIVLRGLQGLDPLWLPGPGIVVTAFTTAGFFVWGMGAFDPSMSVHGEAAEAAHAQAAEEEAPPRKLLIGSVWQIITGVLVVMIVIGGFAALPGGLTLVQTVTPGASPTMVGYVPVDLPFGGPEVQVSTLVIFALFVIWAFLSLVAAAGAIGFVFYFLSRGVTEAKVVAGGGTLALPASSQPEQTEQTERDELRQRITTAAIFLVTFVVLYLVFYYVAIGLIFPKPSVPGLSLIFPDSSAQLAVLSLVNAAIFTLVILRTQLVLNTIGRVAGWLARLLRRVPNILQ